MGTLTQAIQSEQAEIILTSAGVDPSLLGESNDGMDALVKGLVKKYEDKDK